SGCVFPVLVKSAASRVKQALQASDVVLYQNTVGCRRVRKFACNDPYRLCIARRLIADAPDNQVSDDSTDIIQFKYALPDHRTSTVSDRLFGISQCNASGADVFCSQFQ